MQSEIKTFTHFKAFAFACLVFIIPLILANIYYYDDYGRSLHGYTSWMVVDGRPLTELLFISLMQSTRMYDAAPLPLLIGIIIISYSLTVFAKEVFKESNIYSYVIPLTIFGSPFLLEPLSYRFDSLSFAVSIALSIVYIKNIEQVRARFFYGVACITGVFCLYQTSINMLAIMSLIPIHIMINNGEDTKSILRKIYLTIIELVFGLFLYAIINKITFNGAYNNYHPSITPDNIIINISRNAFEYYIFITKMLPHGSFWFILLLAFSFLFSLSLCIKTKYKTNKGLAYIVVISLILPLIAIISICGILLPMDKSLLYPRSIIGLSAYFLYVSTICYLGMKKNMQFISLVFIVPVMSTVLISYAYGNAYRSQYDLFNDIAKSIKSDTKDIQRGTALISFNGSQPESEVYINSSATYPIIKKLVPNEFYNGWWAIKYLIFKGMYQPGNWYSKDKVQYSIHELSCNYDRKISGMYYDIFIKKNLIVVDFDKNRCS
ncbi:Uncharacterised protein [Escherichia coli]|nr:Uncharacterised protein [Escherichia coli]